MASFGRLTAALTSVHNENALSLANLNFDFTLVKLEAPAEFNGLGMTLSPRRKQDGEQGALHKTARRLGALFEGCLPKTPSLFRKYGKRVSEISSQPSINPQGHQAHDGIFASQAGADATSIWAAVTSGPAALASHMLACMLARIFTPPEATAIWAEIVAHRKCQIEKQCQEDSYFHQQEAASLAAGQDIPRKDLAEWDASARAWIQSADQARALQHKQIMLILNNVSVPVNQQPDTYESVLEAWKGALEAMDNLAQGIPQRVLDSAALLAISAWHMYPDMLVLRKEPKTIKQKDDLFLETALLTIGLEGVGRKNVSWSLPLAYLQYYGDPVRTTRSASHDNTHISAEEFSYVMLGCLFSGWKDFAPSPEVGLKWLNVLISITGKLSEQQLVDDNVTYTHWLYYLREAAESLIRCAGVERRISRQLYQLGTRRSKFLYAPQAVPSPLFGISELPVLLPMMASDTTRIDFLRKICLQPRRSGISPTASHYIRFQRSGHRFSLHFTTLIPVVESDESCLETYWVEVTPEELRDNHPSHGAF